MTPGPRGLDTLRLIAARRSDPLALLMRLRAEYGDVVRIRVGDTSQFLVCDLDSVKHVLVDNARNYTKGPAYALLAEVMGRGLVTSEGDHWRSHRRLVQPSLHRDRIAAFVPHIHEAARDEAAALRALAAAGAAPDMFGRLMALALRIVSRTLLGEDVHGREADVHHAITEVFDHIERLSSSRLRLLELLPGGSRLRGVQRWAAHLPSPGRRRFLDAIATLDEIIYGVIRRRAAAAGDARSGGTATDLVTLLLAARDEEGAGRLSEVDVRDEVMTMFIAGHETTATALTWCLYLLAIHPAEQDRVAAEAGAAFGDAEPTLAQLASLRRSTQVFEEALRLYPPIWRISRFAIAPDRIGEHEIPAGSVVVVSPYLVHRTPEHWPAPERFDPDRFGDAAAARPRLAFIPFGAGQRMCLGAGYATVEAQVILSALCRAVRFSVPRGFVPALAPRVALRPATGMPLLLEPRPSF